MFTDTNKGVPLPLKTHNVMVPHVFFKILCKLTWLTHWDRVTHICVSNLTTICSVNGLSPGRHQAITWTNAGILLIGPLGTNFSEIFIEIPIFSFKKMRLKISFAKWQPFCPGLNVLQQQCSFLVHEIIFSTIHYIFVKWLHGFRHLYWNPHCGTNIPSSLH